MEDIRKQIAVYIEEHRDAMMDFWRQLVQIESGSANKVGVDAVARRVQAELDTIGAHTEIHEMKRAGNMLVSVLNEDVPEAPVLLLGHMDTVFPDGTVAARPFTMRDGKAYGPGVLDMKGGVTIAVFAMKALKEAGWSRRPVRLVLAGDEEVGHCDSDCDQQIMEQARGAVAAFNCESGRLGNEVVIQRKGALTYRMDVTGIAAHAGNEPEKGRSAILEMAHKVIAIQNLTDWQQGTTYNVGVISGGTVANAVPDAASIIIDVRYLKKEYVPDIEAKLQDVARTTYVDGTKASLTRLSCCIPMERMAETDGLLAKVQDAYASFGMPRPSGITVGGGSDSAYTVAAGVPTICAMGVEGSRHHSPEEYAGIESLYARAKALAYVVTMV
ncbi:M20 family metallopeptidase [uncultured Megasphaera sp.]|mgnify:FL=1|jgi:glutamate carboxypeptidase|uniref:M20 family metallopeptidase n=1 Tax=uncultured Megasphaera sp. TaxID=165188 RepID=UPI0025E30AB5|nr:M20 family metallopeptidase [uncultured Megasphaera sp.]